MLIKPRFLQEQRRLRAETRRRLPVMRRWNTPTDRRLCMKLIVSSATVRQTHRDSGRQWNGRGSILLSLSITVGYSFDQSLPAEWQPKVEDDWVVWDRQVTASRAASRLPGTNYNTMYAGLTTSVVSNCDISRRLQLLIRLVSDTAGYQTPLKQQTMCPTYSRRRQRVACYTAGDN